MPIGRAVFIAIIYLFTYGTCNTVWLYAGEKPVFSYTPLQSLSFSTYNLTTTYPLKRYTFPNQDGTFADEGLNYYISATGTGAVSDFLDFNYDFRVNNVEGVRFKKGSLFLRTRAVSLEIGRNNIWLGNAYYGSLLLSNNAEPYTLIRFRTEQPFRIPYIGTFDYSLFHGWPRNFNIIGHTLSWYPASWFEFNLKQTISYTGTYGFSDYLKMFSGREANISGGVGQTDSRASFEIAADLRFLSNLSPNVTGVKMYGEYGGEDLYAKWQTADAVLDKDLWVGPFGFELLDTGIITGLLLTTTNAEFIIEYAQNYKSHYVFYDPYDGGRPYNISWYRHTAQPAFTNNGALMGHHMGSAAEMLSMHYTRSFIDFAGSFIVSRRHRWNIMLEDFDKSFKSGVPENQISFGGKLQYQQSQYSITLHLLYNAYKNVDRNTNSVINDPVAGHSAEEFIAGFVFTLLL